MSKKKDVVSIADLVPDDKNANTGTLRGASALEHSLRHYGAGRSVLVDRNNRIIAGNKTIETAASIGLEDAVLVETTGDRVVVVRRADIDLDSPEGRGLAIADNRAGELNLAWNQEVLAELGEEIDLSPYFFEDELDFSGIEEPVEGLTDEDDVPEVGESPVSERGDIWILGNHRVMCGDSTDAADVALLMDGNKADMCFTDPPYGVNYTGGHFHSGDVNIVRKREKLENDTSEQIYTDAIPVIAEFCDGPVYTWFADTKPLALYEAVNRIGTIHALIIWHKTNAKYAAMNAQYKQRHEPCLYWKPKKSTLRWCGASTENTLWEIKRDAKNTFHPTQKPVDLAERAISNHTVKSVLDLFLGSGSTLIAAEKTSRKCYGMEIAPAYVDVIIKRWQDFTGKQAIHDNGRTYQEMSDVRS